MGLKGIIIDDEPKLRQVLEIKLKKHCPEIEIVDMASNAEEAYEKINKHAPNIIFLDIQMPGESGFDLLNRFESFDFEIIFVTGYNNYALKALKVSAVDYILKPIETEDLKRATRKAKTRILERKKIERYDILKHNLENIETQSAKIVIPSSNLYQYVKVNDILHCEGWQKYTRIHLSSGEVILSSYNIGVFKDMLNDYSFYSPHKSHLINLNKIVRYRKDGFIVLDNNSEVPVSRRRKEDFLETLDKHNNMI